MSKATKVKKLSENLKNVGICTDSRFEKAVFKNGIMVYNPLIVMSEEKKIYIDLLDPEEEGESGIFFFDENGEILNFLEEGKTQLETFMKISYILGRLGF